MDSSAFVRVYPRPDALSEESDDK